jgi:hypothetical protein
VSKEKMLGKNGRKVLKALHITFISLVGGGLFSMMLLFLVKRGLGLNENVFLIGMFILTWFWLGPSINGMTSLSDAGFHLTVSRDVYLKFIENSFLYTLIEFGLIYGILFISTIKPWGIIRVQRTLNRTKIPKNDHSR